MSTQLAKELLQAKSADFWPHLVQLTRQCTTTPDLLFLDRLRRQGLKQGLIAPSDPTRAVAILGGYTLYPLSGLLEHLLWVGGWPCQIRTGGFDQQHQELYDDGCHLWSGPLDGLWLLPGPSLAEYRGPLLAKEAEVLEQAQVAADELKSLCELAQRRCNRVLINNFVAQDQSGLGSLRSRVAGSRWNFVRQLNAMMGQQLPSSARICDLDFLSCRRGLDHSLDPQAYFATKQPGSPGFLLDMAREAAHLLLTFEQAERKVLVLDLDNTLWGGEVGERGVEGIDLGSSAAGQAFVAFQRYIQKLKARGVLLAVCSKNDPEVARQPFLSHPDMVLKLEDFVSFKASWNQKAESIREIAAELNLGLDSLVFVDDNPAEIGLVSQFLPEVGNLALGPEPATFIEELERRRFFEPKTISREDLGRTATYQNSVKRGELRHQSSSLEDYLSALEMRLEIAAFRSVDLSRICQLINKSNQFNLTTLRQSEAELQHWLEQPGRELISLRLEDRFDQHGLTCVVMLEWSQQALTIVNWVMSCRILERGVEKEVINDLARRARQRGLGELVGKYRPSPRNHIVADLYPRLGFQPGPDEETSILNLAHFEAFVTPIEVTRSHHDKQSNP